MKGSMKAATAIGVGYLLGRNRKFRTAAITAVAVGAGGGAVGGPIMRRGMKMLGSADVLGKVTPQLSGLVDVVRDDLVAAGKAAATTAVSNRVDALTDSIHDRAERVRNVAATAEEGVEKATEAGQTAAKAGQAAGKTGQAAAKTGARSASGVGKRAGSTAGGTARRPTRPGKAEPEAETETDERDDYEEDNYDGSDADERDDYEDDDYEDDRAEDEVAEDDEDDEEEDDADQEEADTAPPRRRSTTTRQSPVTRGRR